MSSTLSPHPNGAEAESTIFTLAQIEGKLSQIPTSQSLLQRLPPTSQMIFRNCTDKRENSLHKKLQVGWYRPHANNSREAICAAIDSKSPVGQRTKISYVLTSKSRVCLKDVDKIGNITWFAPFNIITASPKSRKLWFQTGFLILFYFLKAELIRSIEFRKEGFDYLRLAIDKAGSQVANKQRSQLHTIGVSPAPDGNIAASRPEVEQEFDSVKRESTESFQSHVAQAYDPHPSSTDVQIEKLKSQLMDAVDLKELWQSRAQAWAQDNETMSTDLDKTRQLLDIAQKHICDSSKTIERLHAERLIEATEIQQKDKLLREHDGATKAAEAQNVLLRKELDVLRSFKNKYVAFSKVLEKEYGFS